MIVVPKQAARLWLVCVLDYVKGNTAGPNPLFMLHLYRNDIAPNADTVLADFLEASFPGYSARAIGGLFPFPVTNADGQAESASGNVIWVPTDNSSNEVIHGWYLTLQSDIVPAVFFCAERLVPQQTVNQPGAQVCVNVRLNLGSRFN